MNIWTVQRQYTVYWGDPPDDIRGNAQVFCYANRGYMYSIIGRGSGFVEHFGEIMQACKAQGQDSLEGPMVPEVAELIREKVESLGGGFEYDGEAPIEGAMMPWVRVVIP